MDSGRLVDLEAPVICPVTDRVGYTNTSLHQICKDFVHHPIVLKCGDVYCHRCIKGLAVTGSR